MTQGDAHDPLPPLDSATGPARHLSAARATALIDGALAAFDELAPAPAPVDLAPVHVLPARRARGARRVVWALVACGFVLSAGAFAAGWRMRTRADREATAGEATAPSSSSSHRAARRAHEAPRAQEPVAAPPLAPATNAPTALGTTAPAPHRAAPSAPESADDLLRAANELRAQHRWQQAARAYDRVRASHPGTRAAHVAAVASGALALEQLGRPAAARRAYRAALGARPDGPLAEEARWGVASAERALGHRAAEAAALREFVRRYPSSLRRAAAEARLREID